MKKSPFYPSFLGFLMQLFFLVPQVHLGEGTATPSIAGLVTGQQISEEIVSRNTYLEENLLLWIQNLSEGKQSLI